MCKIKVVMEDINSIRNRIDIYTTCLLDLLQCFASFAAGSDKHAARTFFDRASDRYRKQIYSDLTIGNPGNICRNYEYYENFVPLEHLFDESSHDFVKEILKTFKPLHDFYTKTATPFTETYSANFTFRGVTLREEDEDKRVLYQLCFDFMQGTYNFESDGYTRFDFMEHRNIVDDKIIDLGYTAARTVRLLYADYETAIIKSYSLLKELFLTTELTSIIN